MEQVFGSLAMVFGILTFMIGLSAQAWKQYKQKRCGISIIFAGLGMTTSSLRIVYFVLKEAWYTIPPDVVGLAISAVIVYQYGAYERHWWGDHQSICSNAPNDSG